MKKQREKKKVNINLFKGIEKADTTLFNVILVMLCFGLVMCFSASAPSAEVYHNDSYYFLKKQILMAIAGLFIMIFTVNIDLNFIKKNTLNFAE